MEMKPISGLLKEKRKRRPLNVSRPPRSTAASERNSRALEIVCTAMRGEGPCLLALLLYFGRVVDLIRNGMLGELLGYNFALEGNRIPDV